MNEVPSSSPSMTIDTNISPNPVVITHQHTTTTTTTAKRVEFNFVPSMMMFANDDAADGDHNTKIADDEPHDVHPNAHAVVSTATCSTTATGGGGSGGAVLWDTETGTFLFQCCECLHCKAKNNR